MNIAIVGSGLFGRLLAWRLNELNQGIKITLIDEKDRHFFGTGLVAAAMVAPYTEAVNTEASTQVLGARSFQLWQEWLPQLEAQTNKTISFLQTGTLVISHPQDEADWQRFSLKAKAVVKQDQMQLLGASELHALEPQLPDNFKQALFFEHEGVVNNLALYPALNDYFEQSANITLIENQKIALPETIAQSAYLTEIEQGFDHIFDCRGNGARDDLKDFRSVRGEVARVYAPEVDFKRAIRLIHPRFPLYIAPRDNHEYIIGATQIESEIDTPVTVRSGLELLSALYSLHQGFGEAQILDLLVGLRPTFIDNQPRIKTHQKLSRLNGLYRHGYLFAPALINDLPSQFTKGMLSHD